MSANKKYFNCMRIECIINAACGQNGGFVGSRAAQGPR